MDSLRATLTATQQALAVGATTRALELIDGVLHAWPHCIDAQRFRGDALLHARRYVEAIGAYERVLGADPEHVDALYGLGAAHQALKHTPAVITAWERALQIDPHLAERRTRVRDLLPLLHAHRTKHGQQESVARVYLRSGMHEKALPVLRDQALAQPDRADLRVALAEALWRDGRAADAERLCYELLALQPQLLKPTLLLAFMLLERDEAGGEALWQRAQRQDPLLATAHTLFDALPNVAPPAPEADLPAPSSSMPDDAALLSQLLAVVPPAAPSSPSTNNAPSGLGAVMDDMLAQADEVLINHVLQLAVARLSWQTDAARALQVYERLIHDGALLAEVIDDLGEYANNKHTAPVRQQIYRLLGDAYMRQHRVAEARAAYGRAFGRRRMPQPAG